jgi:hypothetical protein
MLQVVVLLALWRVMEVARILDGVVAAMVALAPGFAKLLLVLLMPVVHGKHVDSIDALFQPFRHRHRHVGLQSQAQRHRSRNGVAWQNALVPLSAASSVVVVSQH